MARLILVAASGLAREALTVARASGRYGRIRVVDDDSRKWGTLLDDEPVEGGLDLVQRYDDHEVLVCAGRGTARRALVGRLVELGVEPHRYATVVHPSVDVPETCRVSPGSILLAQVALTTNVAVGNHVVVMPNATLTHDDVIEDFVTICSGVSLGGGVHVRSGAYLGMNSSVREGVTVGADAVLGMGAALLGNLPPGQVWVGIPAQPHGGSQIAAAG